MIQTFADWIIYEVIGLSADSRLGSALDFFVYDSLKILLLLFLISALMGVVSALLRFGGFNPVNESWLANPLSEVCSLGAYILLIAYFIRATKTKGAY